MHVYKYVTKQYISHHSLKDNFEFMEHFLRIRIPFEKGYEFTEQNEQSSEKSREKNTKGREKSREKILNLISENPNITISELAETTSLSSKTIEKHIKNLKADNKIKRVGADKGGHWEVL